MYNTTDNQLKQQTIGECIAWPLIKSASDRLALRGRRIMVADETEWFEEPVYVVGSGFCGCSLDDMSPVYAANEDVKVCEFCGKRISIRKLDEQNFRMGTSGYDE